MQPSLPPFTLSLLEGVVSHTIATMSIQSNARASGGPRQFENEVAEDFVPLAVELHVDLAVRTHRASKTLDPALIAVTALDETGPFSVGPRVRRAVFHSTVPVRFFVAALRRELRSGARSSGLRPRRRSSAMLVRPVLLIVRAVAGEVVTCPLQEIRSALSCAAAPLPVVDRRGRGSCSELEGVSTSVQQRPVRTEEGSPKGLPRTVGATVTHVVQLGVNCRMVFSAEGAVNPLQPVFAVRVQPRAPCKAGRISPSLSAAMSVHRSGRRRRPLRKAALTLV